MASIFCFNPRIRDGCEEPEQAKEAAKAVSIHASVMDAKSLILDMQEVI